MRDFPCCFCVYILYTLGAPVGTRRRRFLDHRTVYFTPTSTNVPPPLIYLPFYSIYLPISLSTFFFFFFFLFWSLVYENIYSRFPPFIYFTVYFFLLSCPLLMSTLVFFPFPSPSLSLSHLSFSLHLTYHTCPLQYLLSSSTRLLLL